MKKLASLLLLLLSFAVGAQAQIGQRTYTAKAPGTSDQGISNIGSGIAYHLLTWNAIGDATGCSVQLEQSTDDATWTDLISSQSCSTTGQSVITNVVTNYIQIQVTAFSGTGSVVVHWDGFTVNPSGATTVTDCNTTNGIAYQNGTIDTLTCGPDLTFNAGLPQLDVNNSATDGPFSLVSIRGLGQTNSLGITSLVEIRTKDETSGNFPLTLSNESAPSGSGMLFSLTNVGESDIDLLNPAGEGVLAFGPTGSMFMTDLPINAYWDIQSNGQLDGIAAGTNPLITFAGLVSDGGEASASITGCGGVINQLGGIWIGSFQANSTTCTITITPGSTTLHGYFCKAEDLTTPLDTIHQTGYTTTACLMTGTTVVNDLITFYVLGF